MKNGLSALTLLSVKALVLRAVSQLQRLQINFLSQSRGTPLTSLPAADDFCCKKCPVTTLSVNDFRRQSLRQQTVSFCLPHRNSVWGVPWPPVWMATLSPYLPFRGSSCLRPLGFRHTCARPLNLLSFDLGLRLCIV